MRTYKYIPFVIAIILHILPFLSVLRKSEIQKNPTRSSFAPKIIELTGFSTSKIESSNLLKTSGRPIKRVGLLNADRAIQKEMGNASPPDSSGPLFLIYNEPSYPRIARQNGNEGMVRIKAFYNQQGVISRIDVLESSGLKMLDQAVIKAAKEWKLNTSSDGSFEKTFQFKLNK